MLKRVLAFTLCAAMLSVPVMNASAAFSSEITITESEKTASASSGSCGDNISWSLSADGTLSFTGSGAAWNYALDKYVPWFSQAASVRRVSFSGNITSIGSCFFSSCTSLNEISIPEGVTSVGASAFQNCSSLHSVKLPTTLVTIGKNAFYNCPVSELYIYNVDCMIYGDGTTTGNAVICCPAGSPAEQYAKTAKKNYKTITPPATTRTSAVTTKATTKTTAKTTAATKKTTAATTVTTTAAASGQSAYDHSKAVTQRQISPTCSGFLYSDGTLELFGSGSIPSNVSFSFFQQKFNNVLIINEDPKNGRVFTDIGSQAFASCHDIQKVTMPDTITNIGDRAFRSCRGMTSIVLSNKLQNIGEYAFENCDVLTDIVIPTSVNYIGRGAFQSCPSLQSVIIMSQNCNITDDRNTFSSPDPKNNGSTVVLRGIAGSSAQNYAAKYGYRFEPLNDSAQPVKPTAAAPDAAVNHGDANLDGHVTLSDALAVLQFIANEQKYPLNSAGVKNADCCNTGDGITGYDALAIQMFETGAINKLPLMF